MYMDGGGKAVKDRWIKSGGEWYYLKSSGYMARNEWIKDGSSWCWVDESGKMVRSVWITDIEETYYIDSNGHMVTGSQTIDGKVYHFSSGGKLINTSSSDGLISAAGADVTYVVNTNTCKFHLPGCRWVKEISSQNREDVCNSYSDLINLGYSPCKVCM